ncbi:acyl-CoA dehydrogenase family protein [Variovorax saccharolyticus]|uniref:acyl-CoA dehydrogenase family protein n=1 Tax=Variovorax saccharolyticus TaxID=3053516 RepID=UPI00257874AE|nr:acyl-CoA dehydrogenase family protein [Variovorax sp. J22R187]MDM0018251.1 acyl-CoA dehydrogenase family protein [Variovorax sp. J22R187]
MEFLEAPPLPFYFTPEHEQFRAGLREFVSREITPFVAEWDEAETFPRELYARAASLGVQGLGYPEAYGGTPADVFFQLIVAEEFARCGGGGLQASLNSHSIALPPILHAGSEALKQRVIPPVLAGEKIAALAVTEPSGGSDVAALRTTAVRDGDHYVVNGEKTFITSGMRADFITTAVRTDPAIKGAGGISVLLIDGDTPGLTRTALKKMGWWSSDTAHLRFDGCRVPAANLVGVENKGFKTFMNNFNTERLFMSALACGFAEVCLKEAVDWTRQRISFGMPLSERQVVRHKLMDMTLRIDAARTLVYDLAYRIEHKLADPARLVARVCLAKVQATQAMQFCADQAVQLLGGMGYMRGTQSERIYREVKVMMIGGGSEEVMKDLAARQLGL